mgnify:CR=1 FL=1
MSSKQVLIRVEFREWDQVKRVLRFLRKHGLEFEVYDEEHVKQISKEEYEAV